MRRPFFKRVPWWMAGAMFVGSVACVSVADEPVYFLVASEIDLSAQGRPNDSYVLPLVKAIDIQRALQHLLDGGLNGKYIFARIAAGADGINRDYLSPQLRPWSWQVTSFDGFYDASGNEDANGSPTFCEQSVPHYVASGIAFRFYTIVRELGPEPLAVSAVRGAGGVELYWSSPGTNYVFTLEASPSLVSPAWAPLPGVNWPQRTNAWTLSDPAAGDAYFRVRAEKAK